MKWLLVGFALVALTAGMTLGYLGHTDLLGTGLFAFLCLLVVANLDRISEFKASSDGIEARTREVVERAETAISELQLLATQLGELSLSLVKRQGRLGGYTDDEQESIKGSVLSVLSKLGIPASSTENALRDWHKVVEFDYSYYVLGGHYSPNSNAQEVMAEWNDFRKDGLIKFPSPQEARKFLSKYDFLSAEREQYIQDYEYYCLNRTHRRPDVWRTRATWGPLLKQ